MESLKTRSRPGRPEGMADAATNAPGLAVSQKLTVLGVGTLPGLLDPLAVVVTDERGGGLL